MSYTFLDQQNKLSQLLGDSNTSTEDMFPLAARKKELNRGEMRFALDTKYLREYATGTIASMKLDFPSDLLEIFCLYVNGSTGLKTKVTKKREVSVKDLEKYSTYAGDLPLYYTWEKSGTRGMTFLGSTGNNGKTYELFYIKKPTTEMDLDAAESLFPEEFREASVYYAASELMRQIGKTELATTYKAEYLELVGRAQKYVMDRDQDYDYPTPDFGGDESGEIDVQGGGMPF